MEHKVKTLQETKAIFNELETDPNNVLFSIDELLKKLKKSLYTKDNQLLKLVDLLQNNIKKINDEKVPIRLGYVEKKEIDRSTLYSFDGPFQLLHADVANLKFLGKSASVLNYSLLIVELYSSKVYVYLMCSRKQILKKLEKFHIDVQNKRKNWHTRQQVDNKV